LSQALSADKQVANTCVMIRPSFFGFNHETAEDNYFQNSSIIDCADEAKEEFDQMVYLMKQEGIKVEVFDDDIHTQLPDAVFPNNWLGLHPDGKMVIYPMFNEIRRKERRKEIIDRIVDLFKPKEIFDFTFAENQNQYCEGTGSLIFDHISKRVYAATSKRTSPELVIQIAGILNYEPVIFETSDDNGYPYYHTNVMMTIGSGFVIVCAECIDEKQRTTVLEKLKNSDREIIIISREQVNAFCGNVLEIKNSLNESIILMSERAASAFSSIQMVTLQNHGLPLQLAISTIERVGGGGVRCMIAEGFK